MTTKNSSVRRLRAQADRIAAMLKTAERGGPVANDPAGKIAKSLALGVVKFGIAMDDKVITIEMPWPTIRAMDEAAISEWILAHMQESIQ